MSNANADAASDLSISSPASRSYAMSDWLHIYQGVSHRVGAAVSVFAGSTPTQARLQRVNVLCIDLQAKGIDFYVTPQKDGDNGRTAGQTVTEFMRDNPKVRLAINANFTSTCPKDAQNDSDHAAYGLVVSQGCTVCDPTKQSWIYPNRHTTDPNVPTSEYAGAVALLIRRNHSSSGFTASFEVLTAFPQVQLEGVYAAVAGSARPVEPGWQPRKTILPHLLRLIENGKNMCQPDMSSHEEIAARTGIGIKGKHLYLVTIEGHEQSSPRVQHGAKLYDLAQWMMALEVDDAISLDGGGSTVMAKYDAASKEYVLLNTPYGDEKTPGYQRVVGVYFGVIAADLPPDSDLATQ